jgi:transposase
MELIPMSQIDSILGLPGVTVQHVDRKLGIHVWTKPNIRQPCVHCASDSIRIKATHSRTLKHTRQGNQIMILHLSIPKHHGQNCNRYFRHQFPGVRPRLRVTESYRFEVFEAHDGGVS